MKAYRTVKSAFEIAQIFGLKKAGNGYTGRCPNCEYPVGFSVKDEGDKTLFYCHAGGCTQEELLSVLKSIKSRYYLNRKIKRALPTAKVAKPAQEERTNRYIQEIWQSSLLAHKTLVERYLKTRGFSGQIPPSIRFIPHAWHSPSQKALPAMVAAVVHANNSPNILALHRTFLSPAGNHKAQVEPNKMILGQVKGLSVHLANATHQLAITEGIETGLSVLQATSIPTWAALSAGGIVNLILPSLPLASEVFICADHDAVGIKAAYDAAEKWSIEGRIVRVIYPPTPGMDFNDLLQESNLLKEAPMTAKAIHQIIEAGTIHALEPPRPLIRELPEAPTFPTEAMGEFLCHTAQAIHEKTQAPMAICAQSVLAAVTVAVQGQIGIQLPTGQVKPVSQFFLSIASSGERKSTCDALAMLPIKAYEEQLREQYDTDYPVWKNQMEAWEKQRSQILGNKKAYPSQQDKIAALDALGSAPFPPLTPLITCPEPTFEGMCKLLVAGQPSIGVFSDEGGQFIGGHGMSDDNKLRTATGLSSVWDGAPIKRVRAGDGVLILPGRRVSMHLMTQPDVARMLLTDRLLMEQGLLSRFLVAYPESTIGKRFWKESQPEQDTILQQYTQRVLRMLELPLPLVSGKINKLSPRVVSLSSEARTLWIQFVNYIEANMAPGNPLETIRGFANKLPEHAARLSALITYVHADASIVTAEAMAMGIELAQYYAEQALRLFSIGQIDPKLQLAQKLLQWLLQIWTEPMISPPDIYQQGPNAIRDKAKAEQVVSLLEEHGWLVPQPEGGMVAGKRRREVWRIIQEDGRPR